MSTFWITNRIPKNYRVSADTAAQFNAWFESMGDGLVDRGNPVFDRSTLGDCVPDTVLGVTRS